MTTLGDAFRDTAARRGSATALLFDGEEYSFAEIGQRAASIAAGLIGRGMRPGDRIAVGLPNSPDLAATALAVIQAGAVLVPLNPAYSADELQYIVGDAGARAAIVTEEHAGLLTQAQLFDLSLIVTEPGGLAAAPSREPAVDPEAAALIVYTSGTTGRPKGAVLPHRALLSNLRTVAEAWRWTERDRLLLTLPCFHLHGLGLGIIASFLVGSSIVLRRRFVAEEICADLVRHAATMFFGVPTMYNRLVALPEGALERHDLSRMRLWVSGSAPLPAATFERFQQRCGATILERFGMTECGFVLATPYEGPRRAGVVGVPLPGISVRVVDADAAERGTLAEVPDGTPGELVIRGPNLFSAYWKRPEDTQRAFIAGYFRSGDVAVREPDGMLRIVGRQSIDIIKTRGFKVSAVEIEDCLQRHPQVREVAVIGVPDEDQGERLVAVVVLKHEAQLTADVLRGFARSHLAPYKVPAEYVFVDEIPQTGPGKFKKTELVRRLARRVRD